MTLLSIFETAFFYPLLWREVRGRPAIRVRLRWSAQAMRIILKDLLNLLDAMAVSGKPALLCVAG
jgi:hypothetical protein